MNDRLREMLTRAGASFEVITHPEVYTAQERAAACRITGRRPDSDPGAMPPFGRLYKMSAFMDSSLADEPELLFEGGTHREEIRMPMGEYLRVEAPAIASVAASPPAA